MAPKIKVPANFGVEHINSPVHGNLLLKLRDGQEIRTNSMIMSYNSPVIDKLTTNLFQVKYLILFNVYIVKYATLQCLQGYLANLTVRF